MLHYWFTVLKILIMRRFQPKLAFDQTLERTFRVRLMDCDGLRVMTASKYPAYMDFIRWELLARSPLYASIIKRGLAPTLGSQKLIYRKPLKRWTRFVLALETMGWDEKWVYHAHYFRQNGQLMAIGLTRALIWKRDVPHLMADIIREAGGSEAVKPPPTWIAKLFADDKAIINDATEAIGAEHG